MGPIAHQRYGCWSAQAPPPLPVRRHSETKAARAKNSDGVIDSTGERQSRGGSAQTPPPLPVRPYADIKAKISRVKDTSSQEIMGSMEEHKSRSLERGVVVQISDSDPSPQEQSTTQTGTDDGDKEPTLVYIPLSGEDYHAQRAADLAASSPDPHPSYPVEPNFKIGDCCSTAALSRACRGETEVADPTAVQEAVVNPSKWILFNQETGQQLDAQTFVDAVLMLSTSTVPRCNPFDANPPESARQRQLAGAWTGIRRSNSNGQSMSNRPSLLPQGSGGINDSGSRSPRPRKSPGMMATSLPNMNISTRTMHMSSSTSLSGAEGTFSLSNVQPGQVLLDVHAGGVRAMCFSPSGDWIATAGADHRALVFRVLRRRDGGSGGQPAQRMAAGGLMSLLGTTPEGGSVSSSKVGQLADVPMDWTVRLVDETPFRVLSGHVGEVVALSWAPDDSVLLTGSADGTVRSWRPRKGSECTGVFEHGGRVTSVSWDPASTRGVRRGGRFLSGCMDGKLRIFSLNNEEAEAEVRTERPVTAVAFAPGGATFVAGLVGGSVKFYRTEGMVQERAAECRRHGLRHSASYIKPVRRLSVGTSGRNKGDAIARRKGSMSSSAAIGVSPTEERVTGIFFRPQTEESLNDGATGGAVESFGNEIEGEVSSQCAPGVVESTADDLPFIMSPARMHEQQSTDEHNASAGDDVLQQRRPRAPSSTVPKSRSDSRLASGREDANLWAGSRTDILVSTNDSRTRVLDAGKPGGVAVRFKLKGHNSDGVQGRHILACYSEDGELVISGSANGYVHVWPASPAAATTSSMRAVAWSNNREREGHERILVCEGKVAVPCAVFAPDNVAHSLGGESTRIIVTGDSEGTIRVFVG